MSHLIVHGGRPLRGSVIPSANKNAVLPILCATLLTDEPVVLRGVPDITDVRKILGLLPRLGSEVDDRLRHRRAAPAPRRAARRSGVRLPEGMRSSIMLIPALLPRFGHARIEGDVKGCTLGVREIDPHIEVFQTFGVEVALERGATTLRGDGRFAAASHWLDYASVTTTENFVLCAALARGRSTLTNAACEPHVQEFCAFLGADGREDRGRRRRAAWWSRAASAGRRRARLRRGLPRDRHLPGAGRDHRRRGRVRNAASAQFPLIDRTFGKFGVEVEHQDGFGRRTRRGPLKVVHRSPPILPKVEAAPWPYLPVDLLPIFIALGARAEGEMLFWNKVYEGALGWTGELAKFGAHARSAIRTG